MCVQIRNNFDLTVHVHKQGWGIIYLLIVHDMHLDLEEYDRAVSLDDIVIGEDTEPVDQAQVNKKAKMLKRVKSKEKKRGSSETNPRVLELKAQLAVKKPCH